MDRYKNKSRAYKISASVIRNEDTGMFEYKNKHGDLWTTWDAIVATSSTEPPVVISRQEGIELPGLVYKRKFRTMRGQGSPNVTGVDELDEEEVCQELAEETIEVKN